MPIFWLLENAYLFAWEVLKTLYFAFHLSAGRQGEKVFIFRCVGDCGGLRRFLRGFYLSAFTYPPDPAVSGFWENIFSFEISTIGNGFFSEIRNTFFVETLYDFCRMSAIIFFIFRRFYKLSS